MPGPEAWARFLPFLSAPRVAFTLADVDWALHDPKALYVRFAQASDTMVREIPSHSALSARGSGGC